MRSSGPFNILIYGLGTTILLVAVLWSSLSLWRVIQAFDHEQYLAAYSYREYDFPPSIIPLQKYAFDSRMIIDDTVHYAPDSDGRRDWESVVTESLGFIRLGPDNRTFGISMFHQLHCLQSVQELVYHEPKTAAGKWHASHCMNYLRQMFLCAADIRLEPFHPETLLGVDVVNGLHLEHTCRDWTKLRDIADQNFRTWPDDVKEGWHF